MSGNGSSNDSGKKKELEFTQLRLAQKSLETSFQRLNLQKESRFKEVFRSIEQGGSALATVIRRRRTDSINESIKLVSSHLSFLDLSTESQIWDQPFPMSDNEEGTANKTTAMDQLTDLVRQLAQMQLQQQGQPVINRNLQNQQPVDQRQRPGEVLKNVTNIIIKFDKNNIMNFLESVELDMTPAAEDKLIVLKISKQRVTGSVSIETKTYVTFAAFKADVLLAFKPKKSVVEIESMLNIPSRPSYGRLGRSSCADHVQDRRLVGNP